MMTSLLPKDYASATLVLRVFRPGIGPAICTRRGSNVVDITSHTAPSVSDLLELEDPVNFMRQVEGETFAEIADLDLDEPALDTLHLLPPCDLQAIKAAGVTFAKSMLERVIEERAAGYPPRPKQSGRAVSKSLGTACPI